MSAILPPSQRHWWKQPIDKLEWLWIGLAFAWGMVMFGMMIYWHINGRQNLGTETYRSTREMYAAKAEKWVAENTIRKETEREIPVVKAMPGSDVYLIARLWEWWPIVEMEQGQTYRVHLYSMDYNHGFSLQPTNFNIQVVPGYEHVVKMTPNQAGTYAIVCNEFCGIGHHSMLGRIYVK